MLVYVKLIDFKPLSQAINKKITNQLGNLKESMPKG